MPRLRLDVALTLLVLAVLALAPFIGLGANHYLTMFARMMILAAAAVSLSFLVGGAGLASLGHAAAMGVGAYAVAILDAHRLTDITIVLPVAIAAEDDAAHESHVFEKFALDFGRGTLPGVCAHLIPH
jgi:branched-chain amino acid transport system permease protein